MVKNNNSFSVIYKTLSLLIVLTAFQNSLAQSSGDELEIEMDSVYSEPIEVETHKLPRAIHTNSLPRKKEVVTSGSQQPIYILNQSNPTATALNNNENELKSQLKNDSDLTANQVQKQPTTIIEAQPLTESRAEMLRKARQESEVHTEQKIVEKLESSRLEDEKRRADYLFGDKFNKLNDGQYSQTGSVNVIQQQTAAARDVVTPVQVAAPTHLDQVLDEENIQNHGHKKHRTKYTSKSYIHDNEYDSDSNTDSQSYFSAMIGTSEFNKVSNIQGVYATGFGLGVAYQSRLLVEADFIYSQFERNFPLLTTIDQYTFMAQLKYQILSDLIRPVVGSAISYSYRTFDDGYQSYYDPYYYNNSTSYNSTSNTLDVGLLAGIDVAPNDDFSVGIEYRYMWNLTHKTNGYYPTFNPNQQAIDNLNYYVLGLNTKFTF